MAIFTITTATSTAALDAKRAGKNTFTVTNVSRRPMKARAEVRGQGAAKPGWFTVEGETERDFPVEATQRFTVAVAVPPGVAAGTYSFRLDVVSVANPDDDFAEGPYVNFEVAAAPPRKPFPWWIPVVALVVVGLGLGLWWWLSGGVPNLTGLDVAAAQSKLTEEGYALGRVIKRHTGEKQPGTVSDQKLIPGGKVVDVYVEPYQLTATDAPDPLEKFKPVIELPDFRKHELKQAALRIMVLKIGYKVLPLHSLAATQPVVAEQSPPPGEIIDPKQQITLVYVLPAPKAPSGNDLFRNVKVLKPAATLGGLGVERMFDGAGTCFGGEHGNTLFADGLPPGFVHAVEWATETPVSLEAVRLFGTHDTVNCAAMAGFGQRGLLAFRLLGKLKENDKYEDIVNTGIQAPNNYVNGIPGLLVERGSLSVKAQFFMALFTQSTGLIPGVPHMSGPHGTPFGGPRIMEIDGFGMPLEIK